MIDPIAGLQCLIIRRLIGEQRMAQGAVQVLGLAEQLVVVKRALDLREIPDGQVQPLLQQQSLHVAGHGAHQLDAHRFVTLAKAPDRFGHPLQHRLVERFGQAQAHLADQAPGHAVGLVTKRLDGLEQAARRTKQLFAFGRDPKATLATAAQAIAETGLQPGHLLADA
ncbi:hypothetical protein D3C76_1214750 [compost metagenome]